MTASRAAKWLTVDQVADHLAIGRDSVLRAIKRGDLMAFQDGRLIRVREDQLEAYIAAKTTGAPRRLRSTA